MIASHKTQRRLPGHEEKWNEIILRTIKMETRYRTYVPQNVDKITHQLAFHTWWRRHSTNRKPDRNRSGGTLRARCSPACPRYCRPTPGGYASSSPPASCCPWGSTLANRRNLDVSMACGEFNEIKSLTEVRRFCLAQVPVEVRPVRLL